MPVQRRKKQQQASSLLPRICIGFATNRLFRAAENSVIDLEGTLSNVLLWPLLEGHHAFFSCFFVGRQKEIVLHSPPLHSWVFTTALLQTALKTTFPCVCFTQPGQEWGKDGQVPTQDEWTVKPRARHVCGQGQTSRLREKAKKSAKDSLTPWVTYPKNLMFPKRWNFNK